jgi:hypothetical protein
MYDQRENISSFFQPTCIPQFEWYVTCLLCIVEDHADGVAMTGAQSAHAMPQVHAASEAVSRHDDVAAEVAIVGVEAGDGLTLAGGE